MQNSYRIRTQVGVDKSIKVLIDQDFDYLEILSLKLVQSEIYNRQCADYGVIIGRVTANGGAGIPNAKVSVFLPLTNEDKDNPIISDIYPYTSLTKLNEDGYRYNLLPYKPSYSAHVPTGTFFDKSDVLTNPDLITVFDKYFKYTAKTNESGDYMIFGVPVGSQTVHMDVDLSDIGEFSLSPQDLVRMGVATEAQVAGTRFKSSENLSELPQIISINRVIEVEPLWGQPEICNLGITRTDFDLTDEANITITPTAIFMGSIISSNDDQFQKRNCKPKLKQGNLCNLVTGPGEILAIRQTINQDIYGRPVLETVDLEMGGQVIDDNGTWLVDVPMNLDYVTTNEFGERVISIDPNVGIPTKGKYRFKVKWNQSPSLSEAVKRGYFLVPNVKEYGWSNTTNDPLRTPATVTDYQEAIKSYTFSLDWNDYGDTGTTIGNQMIQEAIDCEDRFYPMSYNKVYTVSQMIDQYRKGFFPNRMIAIKDIISEECESENYKFPTNDSMFRMDIIYLLFTIMMYIFRPIIYLVLIIVHVLAFLLKYILGPILAIVVGSVMVLVVAICNFINYIVNACNSVLGYLGLSLNNLNCPTIDDVKNLVDKMLNLYKLFTNLQLPNLSYPDCELCSCNEGEVVDDGTNPSPPVNGVDTTSVLANSNINSVISQYVNGSKYIIPSTAWTYPEVFAQIMGGVPINSVSPTPTSLTPWLYPYAQTNSVNNRMYSTSLTLAERINLFNTKSKYFDSSATNPGGGVNRIKVTFDPILNPTKSHYDNLLVISLTDTQLANFPAGQLVSFQDPILSQDINLTGITSLNDYGTKSITGTTINNNSTITVNFANPSIPGSTLSTTYNVIQDSGDTQFAKFAMDIEYFQVITAMTYNTFSAQTGSLSNSLNKRFLDNSMTYVFVYSNNCWAQPPLYYDNPIRRYDNHDNQVLVFLVRGVDPYTTRMTVKYDLSIIFGNSWGTNVVSGQYKLNQPIMGGLRAVRHNIGTSVTVDTYSNQSLYYDSFHFQPATIGVQSFSSFTSNLISYYSSLDSITTPTFTPGGSAPVVSSFATENSANEGLRVNSNNDFTMEWGGNSGPYGYDTVHGQNCYRLINKVSNSGSNVRGYFPNEKIDGGSVMYQYAYFNNPQNDGFPNYNILPYAGAYSYASYYYAPKYSPTTTLTYNSGVNGRQIIMRSDRLPTSTSLQDNINNSFAWQNNIKFTIFTLNDDGVTANLGTSISNPTGGYPTDNDADENPSFVGSVLDTFGCNQMIPLSCYDVVSNTITYKPAGDSCYTNNVDGTIIMKNGCYILVTSIFESLPTDFKLLAEWASRLQITFGACRNVWSHLFTNNWINGTLYAFSIKNDRFFTSPNTSPTNPGPGGITTPNTPYSNYCRDTVILHPQTNNFYYRSSPYMASTDSFVGKERTTNGGNQRNLLFPTTIMDLGPRSNFIQELVMSDDYDGYTMYKLNSTTYGDVSEILNLLIISRLVSSSFLQQLIGTGGAGIASYFNSRTKGMVDADYAQMISINSELGVAPFDASNYPDPLSIFFNGGNAADGVIGIYYSSDTQIRDFISPKRTIINPTSTAISNCAFNYFNVFTQKVPFYQWQLKTGDPDSIFGSESNDWYTDPLTGNDFFKMDYQLMDRIEPTSRYFRSLPGFQTDYYKGYIYAVDGSGNIVSSPASREPNSSPSNVISVGAPFFFYFGLKRGKSAFDRFATKWINFETVTD